MENHMDVLREVFGESSSDSEDFDPQLEDEQITDPIPSWEQIKEINGLWLCRDFLSPQHQSSLVSSVSKEGWFNGDSHNQAMRFGDLPAWAIELSSSIREAVLLGGEGICAHVDLMRFEDGIAIVSLESSCVMHFTCVEEGGSDIVEGGKKHKIPVLLSPGSLVLMSGEARYLWKHEINRKPGFQMWEGRELVQQRRVSITLRKLCQVD
ncbi:hypothetical protein V6N11_037382 [Hibiscus sabdariffa]|uniref:Alpha-ketoglutarate-dependent dioxygenase AlkB-like domain-containing protein n=1 Tax=Hibiscus sabdariffa TaxID=183260 RepID=A0ABR2P1E8_9ROSI